MTITIASATSQTLFTILSKAQRILAESNRPQGSQYTVDLYNPDTVKRIFYEIGDTATTGSMPIAISGGRVTIKVWDLRKINLITETTDTNIILEIT